ncbi:very short patch repair endonuclease [Lutispora sp.]|uniref:very short patch repair endonuclease n=1 Tax=Lutispora sp. TaxID=2828727 RepID=UPI003568C8AD
MRYRKNYALLPGKPDIAITKHKIAIFIDGEFWHGYNWDTKKHKIKSNREYWIPKIEKSIERDKRHNGDLVRMDWKVIRFWEKDIKKYLQKCILEIPRIIAN